MSRPERALAVFCHECRDAVIVKWEKDWWPAKGSTLRAECGHEAEVIGHLTRAPTAPRFRQASGLESSSRYARSRVAL